MFVEYKKLCVCLGLFGNYVPIICDNVSVSTCSLRNSGVHLVDRAGVNLQGADGCLQAERGRLQPAAAEPALRSAPPEEGSVPLHQLPVS